MLSLIYFTHLRALTEPVLSRLLDCLQWLQPRGFACKKEQMLSYCWLNTARVLAGIVLLSTSHSPPTPSFNMFRTSHLAKPCSSH